MESIEIIIAASYFIFGTIIGSFLNVVALRFNTGKSLLGRSECFSCGKELKWFELIPVLSFVSLSGRCLKCGSKISLQYPIVEFFTGLVFLGTFLKFSHLFNTSLIYFLISTSYFLLIFSILIVILIYDLKHKIIPDGFVYSFISLSFFSFWILNFEHWNSLRIWNLEFGIWISAGLAFFLFFFSFWFFSRGKWMGLGDGKLALGIGWLLGTSLGASAVMLAFLVGAVASVALMVIFPLYSGGKRLTMKSEVPFGPFLILGLMLVFFFNINIFNFIL